VKHSPLKLVDAIGKAYIVAYREDTAELEQAIAASGFDCEVLRQPDQPEYATYAAIYRCMLNHQRAWQQAAIASQPTLIMEADFVPVQNIGQLPLPFDLNQENDLNQSNVGIAWLYTCAPQIYSVTAAGFVEGFSTALVAYVLTPNGAEALCGLVEEITRSHGTGYYNFDSEIDRFLLDRGFKNYIGFRNYGEHGGRSNPEHRRNGMSGIHRSDVLYGKLAFMPQYAIAPSHSTSQPTENFIWARLQARTKGIGRLLSGKLLRPGIVRNSTVPLRLVRTAIHRQLRLR
jgi:hypothetical protein